MTIASISYSSLRNAASEAKTVAKRLDNYADAIDKSVYGKLNSYNGPWSSNLSTAKSRASSKMSALRDRATKYSRYADDLTDLKEQCETTDKSVKTKVSSLTATFKENHGIKDNKVISAITSLITHLDNSNFIGRWIGDVRDQIFAKLDHFKQSILDWFNWDGGKELLTGIGVFLLELTIGIASIALAVMSGAALIVVIAGVIGGAIMILNSFVNMANEGLAYQARRDDDPAKGKRLSDLDTLSDTLRTNYDTKAMHGFANGLDYVDTVCTVITAVSSAGDLAKKGFKWATGNPADIKNIAIKDVLTKQNFTTFTDKLKTTFANGWTETTKALSRGDWQFFKGAATNFGSDLLNNLRGEYWNFGTGKDGVSTTKNIAGGLKDILTGGFSWGTIPGIVAPQITIADLPGPGNDKIKVDDFQSLIGDISDSISGIGGLVSNPGPIDPGVTEKLTEFSGAAGGRGR